jgi:hypothetical protein
MVCLCSTRLLECSLIGALSHCLADVTHAYCACYSLQHATYAYCASPVWPVLHSCRAAIGISSALRRQCMAVDACGAIWYGTDIGCVLFLMLLLRFVYKHMQMTCGKRFGRDAAALGGLAGTYASVTAVACMVSLLRVHMWVLTWCQRSDTFVCSH